MPSHISEDVESAFQEFMNLSFSMESREKRVFEGSVLAKVIAEKIDALSSCERRSWIVKILGNLGAATNQSIQNGVLLANLMELSDN